MPLTSMPAAENEPNASHLECRGSKKALSGFDHFRHESSFPVTRYMC